MGRMKDYAMWLEEKGYVEIQEYSNGYQCNPTIRTSSHPGDAKAIAEYLEERDAR